MALFQLNESEERLVMKRFFCYIYAASVTSTGTVHHYFDSTWEQVCRFLLGFDPHGVTAQGYKATKSRSQVLAEIDTRPIDTLPSIEVFLDVAFSLNDHRHGIGAKTLDDAMTFDPDLQSILIDLELLGNDGTPSKALQLAAIDRFHFFDDATNGLTASAKDFLEDIVQSAWGSATPNDRDYLTKKIQNGEEIERWLAERWHLGAWVSNGQELRNRELLANHSALNGLVTLYMTKGLQEMRYGLGEKLGD